AASEARFAMLMRADPAAAERLLALAQADADGRWRPYTQLARPERPRTGTPRRPAPPRGRGRSGGGAPLALRGGAHPRGPRRARCARGRDRDLRRSARLPARARLLRSRTGRLSRARGRGP